MSDELLPCPFCGSKAEMNHFYVDAKRTKLHRVICPNIDCWIEGRAYLLPEAAAAWWNTRHEPQPATWTQTPPTTDGFYWVLEDGEKDMIEAFWHAGLRRLVAFRAGNKRWRELSEFDWFCKVDDAPPQPSADDATTARK